MAFANGPEPPQGGFMSGLFSVIGPEIDRQRGIEDKKRDEQAAMYLDMIRSGRLSPAQADVALQNLQKLYPSKNLKTLFGKIGGVIKHFGGQGGGSAPTLSGGQAGGSPQQTAQNAPPSPVQTQQSAPGGAGGVTPPAAQSAHQAFPGASNPTASRGPASNPGPPLSSLPPEWSERLPGGMGTVTMPHPPGVPYDNPDVELQRAGGGNFRPGEALLPRPKEAAQSQAPIGTAPQSGAPMTGGGGTREATAIGRTGAVPAPSAPSGPKEGGFSFGELAHTAFLPPEKLADLVAARQLKLDKSILESREGITREHLQFIESEADKIIHSDLSPDDKQIKLEALGIKGVRATRQEIKNVPGAALKGRKDAFGNPIDPNLSYTQTASGDLYPQAPKEKKLSPDEQLASEAGVPVSQVAKARIARLNRPPTSMIQVPGSQLSDEELSDWARVYVQSGGSIHPTFGLSVRDPNRAKFNAKVAQLYGKDPTALGQGANFKSGQQNLSQLRKAYGQVASIEGAFQRDIRNARDAAKDVSRTDSQVLNKGIQYLQAHYTDSPELRRLWVAIQTVSNQYARIMSSGGRSAVSTVSAQDEAMKLINAALPTGSLDAVLDQMNKEASNMQAGLRDQIEEQTREMNLPPAGGGAAAGPGSQLLPPPVTQTEVSDKAKAYLKKAKGK